MNAQYGLGKFEFAIVLVIFGVLAHLLLDRLVAIEHDTERLEVDLTLRHIHVGLKLAIGECIMRGEETKISALLERNPLDFLERKVSAGETAESWRYDAVNRVLRYVPRQPEAFNGRSELAWRYVGYQDESGRTVGVQLESLK